MRLINARSWCLPSTNNLRLLLALSMAALLGACQNDAPKIPPRTPPPPETHLKTPLPPPDPPRWGDAPLPPLYPPSLEPLQGYFAGWVTIGDVPHGAEALITADGFVRIHVGGSSDTFDDSVQFIGQVIAGASQASGTGIIVGQGCALASGRFCAETASSEIIITLTADDGSLTGQIEVAASDGDETWRLDMIWPRPWYTAFGYLEPLTFAFMEGVYYGQVAEFALDEDTLISVDGAGRFFFQSPASGCVGNGTLAPHLDGAFNVYDVTLTIEVCNAAYASLNGELEGFATVFVSCPDDDCAWLTMWLASAEGAASRTAVTLIARG
jgi:hypothetical protein